MKYTKLLLLLMGLNIGVSAQNKAKPVPVEPGVSFQLAQYRQSVIGNLKYDISLVLPELRTEAVTGNINIHFFLKSSDQPLQIDFKQDASHVKKIELSNHMVIPIVVKNEHILIDRKYLHKGNNTIQISFIAGDAALNRNSEYLYSLSVPDRARTIFPCFDQPNLKARFLLTLTVPKNWEVLSNGSKTQLPTPIQQNNQAQYVFEAADKLPTYLFSFTAGKYTLVEKSIGKYNAEFLYRETDSAKIKLSVDSVFTLHKDAINFLENWTGIPYPFKKVGFVAIPDFQFGGMEHPGAVQYKASSLFLDGGATKDQHIARLSLIAHETAHMWFGDLVTMDWFNDVWMKEVFANFMADKVTEDVMGTETFNLKFLQDHYPSAYAVDRTQGANPIRQQLDNLQDAGSIYGNIIYHKAPIMMRQLENLMGKDNFKKGIRDYLKKYAYGNATWPDLIAILSKYSKTDLYSWNKVWVNQPGRPVFNYKITYAGNKISKLVIHQQPEVGPKRIWPQVFNLLLVYADHTKTIPVNMKAQQVALTAAIGQSKPLFILFNADGSGYGLFPADKAMGNSLFDLKSPLARASAYINLYENMLAGRTYQPADLLELFQYGISVEKNELNLRLLTGYISSIYWTFMRPEDRNAVSAKLETELWSAMNQQVETNNKKVLFNAYQSIYLSAEAKGRMYTIWQSQIPPVGVKLTEDDYTALALSIALKSDTVTTVLKQQQNRITNADRKDRLNFLMPALSLDVRERDAFFAGLADQKNRAKEAWVTTALAYLHHPLRQNTSIKYLSKSLELVEEIQRTGDIFFPQSWMSAIFGSYQTKQAYQIVTDFLNRHPQYNSKLKEKILQSTDNLYRAQKM
jgi:aminopeptidase N